MFVCILLSVIWCFRSDQKMVIAIHNACSDLKLTALWYFNNFRFYISICVAVGTVTPLYIDPRL